MLQLPIANTVPQRRDVVNGFGGYNHTNAARPNELYDMRNMVSDGHPYLTPRPPRRIVSTLQRPGGLFAKDSLCHVDGTTLYIGNEAVGQVTEGEKTFVSMGAQLLVWPDKAAYNTQTKEFIPLEASFVSSGTVMVGMCKQDGAALGEYTLSDTEPDAPSNGDLWLNTSSAPHALYQYSASQAFWASVPTTYFAISASGIGAGFREGDGVSVSGLPDALDGSYVLSAVSEDRLVLTGVMDEALQQTDPITVRRSVPDMEYVAELDNRIWGCLSCSGLF